ncbi:MAG: hypothetical protein P4L53_03965 [Candidatus Obscuribacterales bacterium]|nr:hypothetical protein [Candidatus Obscuribacterales bacterium]
MTAKTAAEVAQSIVGMTEANAKTTVEEANCRWSVIMVDGRAIPEITNVGINRIQVTITDGKVTKARVG